MSAATDSGGRVNVHGKGNIFQFRRDQVVTVDIGLAQEQCSSLREHNYCLIAADLWRYPQYSSAECRRLQDEDSDLLARNLGWRPGHFQYGARQ